ncbi:3'-5' exonuclease domain-containing protein [Tanacetum coccineum]
MIPQGPSICRRNESDPNPNTAPFAEERKEGSIEMEDVKGVVVDNIDIHLVSSTESPEFTHFKWAISHSSIIGLDAEWKPVRSHQPTFPPVLLLQIGCQLNNNKSNIVFLLDLSQIHLPSIYEFLKDVFISPDILKLGFRFKQDLIYLSSTFRDHGCDSGFDTVDPYLDIANIYTNHLLHQQHKQARRKPKCNKSLSSICHELLGISLSKELQCSDWSLRPLTHQQKTYAALDALCLIQIFNVFLHTLLNQAVSCRFPPRFLFSLVFSLIDKEQTRSLSSPSNTIKCLNGLRRRGRPKLRWEDRVKLDMKELLLSEDMISDRNEWRARIRLGGSLLSAAWSLCFGLALVLCFFARCCPPFPFPLCLAFVSCFVLPCVFLCFVALCAPLAPMLLYAFLSLSFACSCSCLLVFAFLRFRGPMLVSDLIVCVASPSLAGLSIVVVVVVMEAWGIRKLLNTVEDQTPDDLDVTNMLSTYPEAVEMVRATIIEYPQKLHAKLQTSLKKSNSNSMPMDYTLLQVVREYGDKIELTESDGKPRTSKKKGKRKSSNGFTVKERRVDYIDAWQGPAPWDSLLGGDGCPKFLCDVMVIKEGLLSSVKTTAQYVFTKRVILEVKGAQFAMVGFRWSMDDPGFLDIVEGLAKHLRCVGIDAAVPYSKKPETRELIDQAIKEKRVLLTRDAKLLRHEYLLKNQIYRVKSLLKNDQLNEVIETFQLNICEDQLMSRCTKCNGRFIQKPLSIEEAIEAAKGFQVIPNCLFDRNIEFWQCTDCNQLYWEYFFDSEHNITMQCRNSSMYVRLAQLLEKGA